MMESTQTLNRTAGSQSQPVQNLQRILLSDGWHDVSNAEKVEFSVSGSPATDGPYTTLRYIDSKSSKTTYTPFRQISGFQFSGESGT